jgi:hypothetical protein
MPREFIGKRCHHYFRWSQTFSESLWRKNGGS